MARTKRQQLCVVMRLNISLRELRFRLNQKRRISRALGLVQHRLVQCRVGVLPELFDFILEEQFSALEFDDAKIVGGQMPKGLVQLTLENSVFPFQFNEMRLNRHIKPPRAGMNLKRDLDDEVYMTWEICR
jgi:hypothetical protein